VWAQALRVFKVLTYKNWGIPQEMLLIITMMVIALILGRIIQIMEEIEGSKLGKRGLLFLRIRQLHFFKILCRTKKVNVELISNKFMDLIEVF
jgi:hypothetical protein